MLQTHQRQRFNDVWLVPTGVIQVYPHVSLIFKCHNNLNNNRNVWGCSAGSVGLWEPFLVVKELEWVKKRSNAVSWIQYKTSSRAELSSSHSLPIQTSCSCVHPTPPNPPCSPVSISSCSTLHTQLVLISGRWWWVGIRTEPLAGKLYTHHTVVTNRENPVRLPPLLLQCANAFLLMCKYWACFCGAKSLRLVHLCSR